MRCSAHLEAKHRRLLGLAHPGAGIVVFLVGLVLALGVADLNSELASEIRHQETRADNCMNSTG